MKDKLEKLNRESLIFLLLAITKEFDIVEEGINKLLEEVENV